MEGSQLAGLQLAALAPAFGVALAAGRLTKRAVPVLWLGVFTASEDWVLATVLAAPAVVEAAAVPEGLHCFWVMQEAAAAQHWALAWEKQAAPQQSTAINKVMRMAK